MTALPEELREAVETVKKGLPRRHPAWETDAQPSWAEVDAALDALLTILALLSRQHELLLEAEEAIAQADREASIAHDAIWAEEVASAGVLHDNEREDSAQAAIWRLHDVLRSWLARYREQEEGQ